MSNSSFLKENAFIKNSSNWTHFTFLSWCFITLLSTISLWQSHAAYSEWIKNSIKNSPFHQVSNRDFSLFLWQNPEFMRVHRPQKNGYLPAFDYLNKVTMDPELADEFVQIPPEVLFRYHTWKRLLGNKVFTRKILASKFKEFLYTCQEWHPFYWKEAPYEYAFFIKYLDQRQEEEDLSLLSSKTLPFQVRHAFIGWLNYFEEGNKINEVNPTIKEIHDFLNLHPAYKAALWKNILKDSQPNYLASICDNSEEAVLKKEELSSFLRVAYYNFTKNSINLNKTVTEP